MLRIFFEIRKFSWKDYVNKFIYVYNCIVYELIGYFSFFLLFGRSLRLLIDVIFDF